MHTCVSVCVCVSEYIRVVPSRFSLTGHLLLLLHFIPFSLFSGCFRFHYLSINLWQMVSNNLLHYALHTTLSFHLFFARIRMQMDWINESSLYFRMCDLCECARLFCFIPALLLFLLQCFCIHLLLCIFRVYSIFTRSLISIVYLMCVHLEIRKTKFICFVHLIFTNNHAISFETDDIFYNYFAVSCRWANFLLLSDRISQDSISKRASRFLFSSHFKRKIK